MSVQKFLDKIKNGRYGADITDAIIGGIKKCYDDASVNHDNANMEVKMARGTHNTLNDRLDNVDEIQAQTNAQLSNIDNKMATKEELGVERKRIDNFTTLSEGSTTGDAELIDGRIGDDGVTYANIGDSIRCQNRKIKNGELNDGSINLNVINDNVIGNKYHFKGEMTSPCVVFDFKNTTLKASDVKRVRVKFRIKNVGEKYPSVLFLGIEKKSWWGNNILLWDVNLNDIVLNEEVEIDASAVYSTEENSILDTLKLGFYNDTVKAYDFYFYDVEIYINDIRLHNVEFSSSNTNVFDESEKISFIADKKELSVLKTVVNEMKENSGDKSIKLNAINDNVIGNKYHFKGEMTSPCVVFDFKNTTLKASDVKRVRVKFRIKNVGEKYPSVLFLGIEKKSWWGNNILLWDVNLNDIALNEEVEIDTSAVYSTEENSILDTLKLGFYNDIAKDYDFYFYDVEIYINGNRIFNVEYSKDNTNVINESKNISFLADKEELIGMKSEIEILKQYDALSKSSLRRITCWGDSITEGGSAGLPWASVLQNLIGENVVVNNRGKSGQCSGNIAFRQGAKKVKVGESFIIPSTLDQIVFKMDNEECRNFRTETPMDCKINGVHGVFEMAYHHETTSYTAKFTRKTVGDSIAVERGSLIETADDNYRNDVTIIWVGRNDIAFAWPYQIDGVIENVKSMVSHLEPTIKRFLIVSVTTATDEMKNSGNFTEQYGWITEINNQLAELYPNNFVNAQDYLVNKCIYDAGITPTSDDLFKMSQGTIPPSLASDGLHPDEKAKEMLAKNVFYKELDKRGWLL